MKISEDNQSVDIDILEVIEELQEQYDTIFYYKIEGEIYIYKPLGRKDFKEIITNEEYDDFDKEDAIVEKTLLYPNKDIEDMPAGVVSKLCNRIIKNSYMDSLTTRANVLDYFRIDMQDVDNQITCIINEAFPSFDIEEIENWGIEKTSKYLSRAEWKLQNFRGAAINYDIAEQFRQAENPTEETKEQAQPQKIESDKKSQSNKTRMTPERLMQLQQQFPDIDWSKTNSTEDFEDNAAVDTTPVALRPFSGYQ